MNFEKKNKSIKFLSKIISFFKKPKGLSEKQIEELIEQINEQIDRLKINSKKEGSVNSLEICKETLKNRYNREF